MLVIRLWNYFRGYVIIRVEGLTLEKFINLAIARDVYLWDIVRIDYTTLEARVSVKGFKELKEVVKRVGCRVNIIEKKGYPFFVHKFKYRKMFGLGFIIALAIIFFLTSFIWSIDIEGSESVSNGEILTYLKSIGIDTGTKKKTIDTAEVKKQLLTHIDSIVFARVEVKGTKLLIEIKESAAIPDSEDKDYPCNIIAMKKAVIEKVIAKNGNSIVERGDIVKTGQVLITGIIDDERLENPLLVHSEGEVYGKTWYNKIIREAINKTIKEETGNVHSTKEIKIGKKRIHLINGDIPFDNYIERENSKKIIDWKFIKLSVEIIEHKYFEVKTNNFTQDIDSLKQTVAVRGVQQIMEKLPQDARVVSKDVVYSVEDNYLVTKISIEVIEQIGQKDKITSDSFKEE